ncbi:MAG: NCS1 family nucleobase:cation symporter-1 [Desulforhopalus sp.]
MTGKAVTKVGEFYELTPDKKVKDSPLYNDDIAPTKVTERTWHKWNVAALWVGMSVCVPTYTLGGVLTAYFGLDVKEALITILLANVIVLIPLILNAFAGTKYGIPFPVLLRSSFGTYGSNIPAIVRAFVACGWFGIQTMFGGMAINLLLSELSTSWASLGEKGTVIGFFIFWCMNMFVVIKGSESIKKLENFAAPLLLLVGLGLIVWASPRIDTVALLGAAPNRPEDASVWSYFFGGLTAMVGFWATLSLNIPDFSRYVKSQKDQITGQIVGLPLTMLLFAALGVVLTAASTSLVGETVSDPITLIGKIDSTFWVVVSMVIIIIATISTNTAANIVSPTNDFQNALPRVINFKRGTLLTGFVGIGLMSWELLIKLGVVVSEVSVESMYSNWLLGYSSLLGPIAGIMIVDYFLIKKQHLELRDLYLPDGIYPAFNMPGIVAFAIPVALTIFSIATGFLPWFYSYGWFTGSLLGGVLYFGLASAKAASVTATASA